MAELGRSLGSPFRDPAWPARALVGAALEVAPFLVAAPLIARLIGGRGCRQGCDFWLLALLVAVALACRFIEIGYLRRLVLATLAGGDETLPRWDRPLADLADGFALSLVALGVFLPAVGVAAVVAMSTAALGAPRLAWVPVLLVLPPLALATLAYLPAALVTAIAAGDLAAAFDTGRVFAVITRRPSRYALAYVVALMALLLAQLGFLLLCVGVFATRFLANCAAAHAFASACRDAVGPPQRA
jgi:hypothetical protein